MKTQIWEGPGTGGVFGFGHISLCISLFMILYKCLHVDMVKSQNLPPSPGPPKNEFLAILKGFNGFNSFYGGPCFYQFFLVFVFFLGFIYFCIVLAVLRFGHMHISLCVNIDASLDISLHITLCIYLHTGLLMAIMLFLEGSLLKKCCFKRGPSKKICFFRGTPLKQANMFFKKRDPSKKTYV